jgi:threonine dehydratase
MKRAILLLAEAVRQTAEGAGAASLAGALRIQECLHDKTVVLILSGGNITLETLAEIYQDGARVRRAAGLLRGAGADDPGPGSAAAGPSPAGRAER